MATIFDALTPRFGVGAMSFAEFYGPTTDDNSLAILDAALEAGVGHIDTANVYGMGRSETVIGAFFKERGAAARDAVTIATKAGIGRDADGNRAYRNDHEYLEAELDKSLERLGLDYVDLFYVHRRQADMPIEEATGALARLIEKGKTRSIGFSEIAPSSLHRAAGVHPIAAVQSEYSLGVRSPELGLVQTCGELGTALVAFSPVGRSLLTDTPQSLEAVQDLPFLRQNARFQSPNYEANMEATDKLRALAAEMGEPTAALAVAWTIHKAPHVVPIPGTRSVAHFRELLRGAELQLSDGDMARIEEALPVGWAHGDRYTVDQWNGPERYC